MADIKVKIFIIIAMVPTLLRSDDAEMVSIMSILGVIVDIMRIVVMVLPVSVLLIMGSFVVEVDIILDIMLEVTLPIFIVMICPWNSRSFLMIVCLEVLVVKLIMRVCMTFLMMHTWNVVIISIIGEVMLRSRIDDSGILSFMSHSFMMVNCRMHCMSIVVVRSMVLLSCMQSSMEKHGCLFLWNVDMS